jgi:cytochrome c-type biogenesis protein CcmH
MTDRNTNSRVILALLLTLAALALFSSAVLAQDPDPVPVTDDQVNAVANGLYCPVCENIPLDACGTQACAQWRDLIREKLEQGWNEQQIEDYFVAQYGDRVLAEPPRRGLNWLVYILPPLFFLAGVYIVYRVLRSMHRPSPAKSETLPGVPDDPYVERFEDLLNRD